MVSSCGCLLSETRHSENHEQPALQSHISAAWVVPFVERVREAGGASRA